MNEIILKPGREKSLLRRHPWVFSGAVRETRGAPTAGETITIRAHDGRFLARAAYSPKSQIVARTWTWDENESIDEDFLRRRLRQAARVREVVLGRAPAHAFRLVHAESDGLPGLIVDRYSDYLVLHSLTAGSEYWKPALVRLLAELFKPKGVYERSDVDVREKEGLPPVTGVVFGDEIPERVEVSEGRARFAVDIRRGHKTGFYLDQRENRELLRRHVADRTVLNCFAYTGAFSVAALLGGAAHVLSIESAAEAISLGRENVRLNGFPDAAVEWMEADVFHALRAFRDSGRKFDVIVLDPPKFAQTVAQVERASRGYKDINWLSFRLLNPGGMLFTFSCSGGLSADLFQKIVAGAALDAGVEAQIVHRMTQAPDHPVALHFPESEYLKGLVCRVAG